MTDRGSIAFGLGVVCLLFAVPPVPATQAAPAKPWPRAGCAAACKTLRGLGCTTTPNLPETRCMLRCKHQKWTKEERECIASVTRCGAQVDACLAE